MTPYQYALHVPIAAHETLTTMNAGSSSTTLSNFNPIHPTNFRHVPHPLLGSLPTTDWPVLVPAPLPPTHEQHVFSCPTLHDIRRTCYALRGDRPDSHAICNSMEKYGTCTFGHDLEDARRASSINEKLHIAAAEQLVIASQAVRAQRMRSGRTELWVHVAGSEGPSGEPGRFIIDGEDEFREKWDMPHAVPWCRVCNPAPVSAVHGPEGRLWSVEQRMMQEEEEGEESDGADSEATVTPGEYGYSEAQQAGYQSTYQPEPAERRESMGWANSESTWQQEEEIDEGLMKKWRETMGKNGK